MQNKYFIKDNYIENPVLTFNSSLEEKYWTKERIINSHLYQYHVYAFAKKVFQERNCKYLLDIGCGPATKTQHFFGDTELDLTLVDQRTIEKIATESCPNAVFISHNLEQPLFIDNRLFDLIICSDVVEHLSKPEVLMESIERLLTSNGILILSTPDRDNIRGASNLQSPNKQHVREWNRAELRQFVESLGFEIEKHFNVPQTKLGKWDSILCSIANVFNISTNPKFFGNQILMLRKK